MRSLVSIVSAVLITVVADWQIHNWKMRESHSPLEFHCEYGVYAWQRQKEQVAHMAMIAITFADAGAIAFVTGVLIRRRREKERAESRHAP